jgi:hypothetical protein
MFRSRSRGFSLPSAGSIIKVVRMRSIPAFDRRIRSLLTIPEKHTNKPRQCMLARSEIIQDNRCRRIWPFISVAPPALVGELKAHLIAIAVYGASGKVVYQQRYSSSKQSRIASFDPASSVGKAIAETVNSALDRAPQGSAIYVCDRLTLRSIKYRRRI